MGILISCIIEQDYATVFHIQEIKKRILYNSIHFFIIVCDEYFFLDLEDIFFEIFLI